MYYCEETYNYMTELKVFVYGTLKVGGRFSKRFDPVRTSVKIGSIKGTLYDLGSFPGVKLNSSDEVVGEIHTYTQAEDVEKSLDRIEGYFGENHPHNLYNKKEVEVTTAEGAEICKVYEFAKDVEKFTKIKEGVWKV